MRDSLAFESVSIGRVLVPPLVVASVEYVCGGVESPAVVDDDDRPADESLELGVAGAGSACDDDRGLSLVSKFHVSPKISTSPAACS